jgi:peptidoglycan hydrolase-like protein with peptidoglycan-binding domain
MTLEIDAAAPGTAPRRPPDAYRPGATIDEIRSGARQLGRGDSGNSVEELQRVLNESGASPPLAVDGLFGPKTEAALREISARAGHPSPEGRVDASTWTALQTEAARSRTAPRTEPPRAPQYGTPAPPGSIPAGELARDDEARRLNPPSGMKSGAPPGYHAMTGRIPPAVVAKAKTLLKYDYGTEIPFESEGRRYLARLERHYHPPGYVGGPNGWHKGVTVYESN